MSMDGWTEYDIHRINRRKCGRSNDFERVVPVERDIPGDLAAGLALDRTTDIDGAHSEAPVGVCVCLGPA